MNLVEEYKNQNRWRDWDSYIKKLPINNHDTIYDMGCSIGTFTKKLANKAYRVIGIDNNSELIKEAKRINPAENIRYLNANLTALKHHELPHCEGIWSSFTAAYFPKFTPVLKNWIGILNPNGWLAMVEMSGLFSHEPLSHSTQKVFKQYYDRQRTNNVYDFEMGSKLKNFIKDCGLSVIYEEDVSDRELTFNGPAEPQILTSWECRFDRMHKFREYLGEKKFNNIKDEFLNCLLRKDHNSCTIVKFIIAIK